MGRNPSEVGFELRALLGFGAFFVAIPLLDDERERRRLFAGLLGIAVALGGWGMIQWFGGVDFSAGGDVGVREGVPLTSGGRGQLQGGLFAFPVAVICCYAALLSGDVRSRLARGSLLLAIVLNTASCLVTYERTFWLATALGVFVVTIKARRLEKAKALLAAPLVVIAAYAMLATFAPQELTTARERFLSLGQYETDVSLRFRVEESRHVTQQIDERPITGSGLGATIYWGQPWQRVPPSAETYAHNGYLWLAWKLGVPVAVLLVLLLAAAVVGRSPPGTSPLQAAARTGAQASLLALLAAGVTFPGFSGLAITATIGLLLALALSARPGTPPDAAAPLQGQEL
jgi:O-antigen ligase